jgi:hypothetical protein
MDGGDAVPELLERLEKEGIIPPPPPYKVCLSVCLFLYGWVSGCGSLSFSLSRFLFLSLSPLSVSVCTYNPASGATQEGVK